MCVLLRTSFWVNELSSSLRNIHGQARQPVSLCRASATAAAAAVAAAASVGKRHC